MDIVPLYSSEVFGFPTSVNKQFPDLIFFLRIHNGRKGHGRFSVHKYNSG